MIGRALLGKLTTRMPTARRTSPDAPAQPGAQATDETPDHDTQEIGEIGDVAERYWEVHHDEAAQARTIAMAKRLPTLLASALRLAWQASRTETITLITCNLAAGAMTTSVLLSTQHALGHLLAGMPTADRLRAALPALIALAVLSGVKELLLSAAGRAQDRLRPRVDRLAELYLYETTTRVDAAAFESPAWADAMMRARDQGTFRARMVVMDGSDVLTGLVGVLAAIIALGVLHPLLVPLAILATVPDGWVAVKTAKMEYAVYRSISRLRRRMVLLGDRMADREHALELRANTLRTFLLREWGTVAEIGQAEQLALANREAAARLAGRAAAGVASWVAYVLLGVLLVTGVLALAVAGAAVLAMQTARSALGRVMSSTSRVYEDGLYFGDLTAFVDDATTHISPADGPAPEGPPDIVCTNVAFAYPGAETNALHEVSVHIRPGEVVALVGENGSGKSTLAKLLAGLYTPTAGTITWGGEDGVDTATVNPDALRARIALISQDHVAWPLTARSNIAMALPRDTDRIDAAATAGCADQLISDLPYGMDTNLDKRYERGTELSGGGRQRIAAARGLYRAAHGADLVIADEPTSEIDAVAEHALLESLLNLRSPARAVVLITHRLSAARYADQILVLDRGRIAECGDHSSLMATDGSLYARMFTLQAARYAATHPVVDSAEP